MPTIDRFGPYRVYIYVADQREPAHVHVERDDLMLKIWIHDMSIAVNIGFSPREIGRILRHVKENRTKYVAKWTEIFGE